ncbi:hypothetical protein FO519_004269 [Halicephalobus sp. NKZ332]|nr:hypothetical protein FO519_004269 [Halicephalobus sp. NKZ332]
MPIIFDIVAIIFTYVLFKFNKYSYISDLNQNRYRLSLSKRYQTVENIRTLKMIFWFIIYCILSNIVPVFLHAFYVFYIDAYEVSELYAYYDASWYLLKAISAALLPLAFIAKHDIMRRNFM